MSTLARAGKIPPVAFEDIVRFFKAAGVDKKCPVCAYANWELFGADGDGSDFMLPELQERRENGARTYFPCVVVKCKRCAYLRLHSKLAIAEWAEANPQGLLNE